jgi:membrane-bound lytic murein transglycosylase A
MRCWIARCLDGARRRRIMPKPAEDGSRATATLPALLSGLVLAACTAEPPEEPVAQDMPEAFRALPGWSADRHADALPALRQSCGWFAGRPPEEPVGPDGLAGRAGDWQALCAAADRIPEGEHAAARRFFETWFHPVAVTGPDGDQGLFTGYFAPLLRGSWQPSEAYPVPIYRLPERRPGRPLPSRAEIVGGALAGRDLELLWVDDPVDAFFLQIQGSGHVELEDGSVVGVGYHGQNGHPYFAIGRALIDWGEASREEMSMELIRDWLRQNPDRADELMNLNPSFIFFRLREAGGVVGTLEVPLTAGRSLAVDRGHVPLGVPMWLDIVDPTVPGGELRRLVLAQDTGGAIRGAVAGDMFWGYGDEAGRLASGMQARGRYFMLLPRSATDVAGMN